MTHDFLLVDEIPEHISYLDFRPEQMVKIEDSFILTYAAPIKKVKMNWEQIGNVHDGIAYHGTTILDTEMSKALKKELTPFTNESVDCRKLIAILDEAIMNHKFIIHFGI